MRLIKGFTLVEVIIYLAVSMLIFTISIEMMINAVNSFGYGRSHRLVSEVGGGALERMLREIRLAEDIDTASSILDTSPGELVVDTVVSSGNSTATTRKFFLQNGTLMMQEGANPALALTTGLTVSELEFQQITGLEAYYVRGSYAGCSDGSDGRSPANAFCTIDHAASVAVAGDIVFVGAGTYNEIITIANSGSQGSPIMFFADRTGAYTGDGGTITVDGSTTAAFYFPNAYGGGAETGKDYIIIDGFRIIGSDNAVYAGHGSDYNIIRNNEITNNLNGLTLASFWGNGSYAGSKGWVIENNDIHQNTRGIWFASGRYIDTVVWNNKLYDNDYGIVATDGGNSGFEPADNVTIEHNEIYDNLNEGIFSHVWFDGTFHNNHIYDNGGAGFYVPYRANSTPEVITFRNNTVRNNAGDGLLFGNKTNRGALNSSSVIENNIITNQGLAGIYATISCSATIRNNDVWGNTGGNYAGACGNLTGTNGNISQDPLFTGPLPNIHLQAVATGHPVDSPGINAGYQLSQTIGLDTTSTRLDGVFDDVMADMGYHYGITTVSTPPFVPGPPSRAVRIKLTVQDTFGQRAISQTFYGTAVLRRSYAQ